MEERRCYLRLYFNMKFRKHCRNCDRENNETPSKPVLIFMSFPFKIV